MTLTPVDLLVIALIYVIGDLILKNALPAFFKKKGENLATKQDVADITAKIESVKHEFASTMAQSQVLYERKIEIYSALIPEMATLVNSSMGVLLSGTRQLSGESLDRFIKATNSDYLACNDVYRKSSIFLPTEISKGVVNLLNAYNVVAQKPNAHLVDADGNIVDPPFDPVSFLQESFFSLADEVRKDIGIEALSKDARAKREALIGVEEVRAIDAHNDLRKLKSGSKTT